MKTTLSFFAIFYSLLSSAQLNEKNDITILKKLTLEDIHYSLVSKTNRGIYLTGISCDRDVWGECTAYVFKSFGGSWQLKDNLTFSNTMGEIDELSSNNDLIYFGSYLTGGTSGSGDYYFNAFSFADEKFYSLNYSWSDYLYSSYEFSNIKDISNKIVLDYFEKKASITKYVYKPSNKLTNREQWLIDNKSLYQSIFEEKREFIIKYSDAPPHAFEKNDKVAENKDYVIYNIFKENLYGYNKKSRKYFVIWVPNWYYDTTIFVFLDDNNIIAFEDSTLGKDGAEIFFNLDTSMGIGRYK